jgi:hypothetical protein
VVVVFFVLDVIGVPFDRLRTGIGGSNSVFETAPSQTYSAFAPEAFTTFAHFVISDLM